MFLDKGSSGPKKPEFQSEFTKTVPYRLEANSDKAKPYSNLSTLYLPELGKNMKFKMWLVC